MRIKRQQENQEAIINMSSLLDVMFILIIFFLATSTLDKQEHDIKVSLPESGSPESLSSQSKAMVINVRKDGTYYVHNGAKTLEQIRDLLVQALLKRPNQEVLIRGDEKALHGNVAAAVLVCRTAGILEANIGYFDKVIR